MGGLLEMNGRKYAEWASHYDPDQLEIRCLKKHKIDFANKRVLEVGCGTGRFTKIIIPDCEEITCIDPDESALEILRSSIKNEKIQIICGTLESFCFKSGYYDYVVFPWSFYLIHNKIEVLGLAKRYLKSGGSIIIIQAMSGEYEKEIAHLYRRYNSIKAYEQACKSIPLLVEEIFGNTTIDTLTTYFEFDNIEQTIDCSLFFIEDEEGTLPREKDVLSLKKRLESYTDANGKVIMSDIVSIVIAQKKEK